MNRFIISQIFGALDGVAIILSSWQKKRSRMFFFLSFDNLFCFIQYMLLKAYTGAFTNVIGVLRLILFNQKGKNKFFKTKWPLIIIVLLYTLVTVLTYKDWTCLFPSLTSIYYAFVLWQDKEKSIRIGSSFMLLSWVIYDVIVGAYVGAISDFIMFISAILAIIRIDILKRPSILGNLRVRHYQKKVGKLLEVNFVDDYDILMEIFENEDDVIKVMARFDEYDRDKQILMKILLNINKSLKVKDS